MEVGAELHELTQVYLVHYLLQVVELSVQRDVLSAVEVEYLLETPQPQVVQVLLHIRHRLLLLPLLFLLIRTQLHFEHLEQLEGFLPFYLRLEVVLL